MHDEPDPTDETPETRGWLAVAKDIALCVSPPDGITAKGSVRVVVAKVGDREAEAALLRDVQADVSAALRDLESEDADHS